FRILFWCLDLGLHNYDRYCKMSSEELLQLPLNFYITILGIGLFILILTFIFCCYMFRLRRHGAIKQYCYNEVKCSHCCQTCAVCLEEFRSRDELGVCPCSHAFHKNCLLKWLEIRSVCPMCNKSICRLQPEPPTEPELFQGFLEV
uniref:RING-type domain-containing protein n=1 Tax=Gasterosteus aculeatus aculeatus TaxID=481459 RepID=A0AAQ4R6Q3_GASAC